MNMSWITKTFRYVGWCFQRMRMRKGGGGNLLQKNFYKVKGDTFMQNKKMFANKYTNIHLIYFQSVSSWVVAVLKVLSLPLLYLWSIQFEQKSTRTVKICFYCKQLLLQIALLPHFRMRMCANSVIGNAVFLIISIV